MNQENHEDIRIRFQLENINSRLYERVHYFNYWNDHCVRYLLFVNAGGIIAVLSFMSLLKIDSLISWAGLALGFFTLGLLLVGLLLDHMRTFFNELWKKLYTDREKLFTGEIADPQQVLEKDNPRVKESKYAVVIGRISSVCIAGGILFGFISFFTKGGSMIIPIKEMFMILSGASFLAGTFLLALSIEFSHEKSPEKESPLVQAATQIGSPGKRNIHKHLWGMTLSALGYALLLVSVAV